MRHEGAWGRALLEQRPVPFEHAPSANRHRRGCKLRRSKKRRVGSALVRSVGHSLGCLGNADFECEPSCRQDSTARRRATGAQARHLGSHAVQLEGQVRRHGCLGGQAPASAGGREPAAEEVVGGINAGSGSAEGASHQKMVRPAAKREAVAHLRAVLQMSERRACTLVAADRKMIRYRSRRPPDSWASDRKADDAPQRH